MFRTFLYFLLAVGWVLEGSAEEHSMTFEVQSDEERCPSCVWLQASGAITSQTPDDFERALEMYPFVDLIHLDSSGGNLRAAMAVGFSIREKGLNTRVSASVRKIGSSTFEPIEGLCHSACVFLLAGGVTRSEEGQSAIGLHQFSGELDDVGQYDAFSLAQLTSGLIVSYFDEMGVSPKVAAIASLADPTTIYELSTSEKYELELLTDDEPPHRAELSDDPFGDLERQAPTPLLTKCDEPRYSSGRYQVEETQRLNRAFRTMCNKYISVAKELNLYAPCQPAWGTLLDYLARMEKYSAAGNYISSLTIAGSSEIRHQMILCFENSSRQ